MNASPAHRIITPQGEITIRQVMPHEIVDLRHRILRAGMPEEAARFPGDEDASTLHIGAFAAAGDGEINIGCVSLMRADWQGVADVGPNEIDAPPPGPAWQLRGMATDESLRGCGIGAALVDAVLRVVLDRHRDDATSPRLLWCNARTPAAGFYQRQGWTIVSRVFEVPTAGPHVRMVRIAG